MTQFSRGSLDLVHAWLCMKWEALGQFNQYKDVVRVQNDIFGYRLEGGLELSVSAMLIG